MAVEHGDRLRCQICELAGKLVTDCRSLSDHLLDEAPRKAQDKRLGIELAALRQGVWTVNGEMMSKSAAKSMKPDYLLKTIDKGLVDVEDSSCEKGGKHVS